MPYTPGTLGLKDLGRFPLPNRDAVTDDIANNILGFDHSMSPWVPANIPGGAGSWSTVVPAGTYGLSTTLNPHHLIMYNQDAAAGALYLRWAQAGSLNALRCMVAIQMALGQPNGLVFEIRWWDNTPPGAGTAYMSHRWVFDNATYPDYPLRWNIWYGVGVTFAAADGTPLYAESFPFLYGIHHLIDQKTYAAGWYTNVFCSLNAYGLTTGFRPRFAGMPAATIREMWFYAPMVHAVYTPFITLDDIYIKA